MEKRFMCEARRWIIPFVFRYMFGTETPFYGKHERDNKKFDILFRHEMIDDQ